MLFHKITNKINYGRNYKTEKVYKNVPRDVTYLTVSYERMLSLHLTEMLKAVIDKQILYWELSPENEYIYLQSAFKHKQTNKLLKAASLQNFQERSGDEWRLKNWKELRFT